MRGEIARMEIGRLVRVAQACGVNTVDDGVALVLPELHARNLDLVLLSPVHLVELTSEPHRLSRRDLGWPATVRILGDRRTLTHVHHADTERRHVVPGAVAELHLRNRPPVGVLACLDLEQVDERLLILGCAPGGLLACLRLFLSLLVLHFRLEHDLKCLRETTPRLSGGNGSLRESRGGSLRFGSYSREVAQR